MKHKRYLILFILIGIFIVQVQALGEDAQEHFRKGHNFYLDSKPNEAELEFRAALRLNPELSEAHYYLGSIYFKQNRLAEAIEQCQQALEISPKDLKSLIILGLSLQQMGLIDQAIGTFQKASQINMRSAAAHSALGLAYCAKADFAKAKEEYNILKTIDPHLADDLLQKISEVTTYGVK